MEGHPRLAVVTGGGSGIGRSIVHRLAGAGVRVAVADIDLSSATEAAASGSSQRATCSPFRVDVTSPASVADFADELLRTLGPPNVLVNNAGWNEYGRFVGTTPTLWTKILDVNLVGVIRITHALLPAMLTLDGVRNIVNIASDAGRVGSSGDAVYSSAKGGVIAFTKAIAREVARDGVVVNCVCPGPTDTPLFAAQPDRMQSALINTIPMRRLARPDEVAGVAAMLASDDASFVTGQVVSVSGGGTMVG